MFIPFICGKYFLFVVFEVDAVADDHQLVRLEDRGLLQHLVPDILTNRDAPLSVDVELAAGKMQVLAAV